MPNLLEKLRIAASDVTPTPSTSKTRSLTLTPTEDFSWEIIVIDNNSSDNTAKLIQEYQPNWSKGEDIKTLSYLRKAGWEIWYNSEMHIEHHIPKWRLEKDYLVKLCQSIGLSRYPTRMLRFATWQHPIVLPIYLINDLRKLVFHVIKYRRILKTDIVVACEMELFFTSLISPFYHWKKSVIW